jgi:drug/metabolite transporter (DMT)-like permease
MDGATDEVVMTRIADSARSDAPEISVNPDQGQPIAAVAVMTWLDWVMLTGLSILWGGSFLFGKMALSGFPPFTIVAGRVGLACLTLAMILRLMGTPLPRGWPLWGALFGMGILNNAIPFSLIIWGQTQVGAGLASVINAMTPLFTVVVAHGLTKDEKLNPGKIIGVSLGILGVVVLVNPESKDGHPLALLSCLGAAMSYGFASVWGRRFRRYAVTPIQTAFGQVTASTTLMIPFALWVDHPWLLQQPTPATIASLLVLGICCTGLAYILFFQVLARAGATAASLVTFMIPPSAIAMGVLVLGESLTIAQLAGTGLIGLGLAAVDGRPARWLSGRLGRRL